MVLRFSLLGKESLKMGELDEGVVTEAVTSGDRMLNYDPITDNTIVLGRTQRAGDLVVVIEGEATPAELDLLAGNTDGGTIMTPPELSVLSARPALEDEIGLLHAD